MEERLGEIGNWLKLHFLVDYVIQGLRKLFLEKWEKMLGHEWDGSPDSVSFLKETMGNKEFKKANDSVQKNVEQGDIENWDMTAISHVLRELNSEWVSDDEKKCMKEAVLIRNYLAHHPSKMIPQKEFDEKWGKLFDLLSSFLNVPETRIAQIKETIKFRTSDSSSVFFPRVSKAEANTLIVEGNAAFRSAAYAQAIEKFDNALEVVSLTEEDRGVLFCYCSAAFVQMAKEERYAERKDFAERAVDDAKIAAHLHPVWIEAHWRLGDAYKLLKKYKKAIKAYDETLSWDPSMEIIRTRRDDCRQELGQSRKRKLMDLQSNTLTDETSDKHPLDIDLIVDVDTLDGHPLSIDLMMEQVIQSRKSNITEELQEKYLLGILKKSGNALADVVEDTWYRFGIDIVVDFEPVANHFSKAADEGNARAIYVLARLTQKGLGVKKDYRRAFQLFKQAAEMPFSLPGGRENKDVLPAMHCTAMMYYEGVGVERSHYDAFWWYKRAADLGFGPSACNLAVSYFFGKGVPDKHAVKAVQYWKLAAQCKNARAMLALSVNCLRILDVGQARKWFKYAVEGGESLAMSIQQEFEAECKAKEVKTSLDKADAEEWEKKENLLSSNLSYEDRMERFLYFDFRWRRIAGTPVVHYSFYKHDTNTYNETKEYALQGKVYAQQVLEAMRHYLSAVRELYGYEISPDATIGDTIIREFALCVETAPYVFVLKKEEHVTLLTKMVKKKLSEVKDQICQMDRYARICYAQLQSDSPEENLKFLEKCIRMYPKDPFFYNVLATTLCARKRYHKGIKIAQKGLGLFQENLGLMFSKAFMTVLVFEKNHADMKNVIDCYEVFLKHAPADHRFVPEAYYFMARITLEESLKKNIRPIDEAVRAYYEKGLESEKQLLPCFLPYEELSMTKNLINAYFEMTKKKVEEKMSFSLKPFHSTKVRKLDRLTDPVRVWAIVFHRQFRVALSKGDPLAKLSACIPPQCPPSCASVDLTPITISEMNPTVDKRYEGHVIEVTIIDDPVAPLQLYVACVVEDTRGDVLPGLFYNVESDRRIKFGAKVSIQRPYLTTRENHQRPMILVDDLKSLIFHEADSSEHPCQSCGENNAPILCPDCMKAAYCSEYCQTHDRKILGHELICNL